VTAARSLMFHKLAEYYDAFVDDKDYRGESRRLETLARRYCRSGGRSWLDVACGTGRHLEFLRRSHSVVGLDRSVEMLRVARHRLPKVRFVKADMRTFRLDRSFDVVSCTFGAVGHLATERDLRAAFTNFARHLKPGGVAIVEPWIDPAGFRPGFLHLMKHEERSASLVRLSHSSRRGNHSVLQIHYLIGEPSRGIRHFEETEFGLMVSRRRLRELMADAGLVPRLLPHGLRPGRGLLLGTKPRSRRSKRRSADPSSYRNDRRRSPGEPFQ